MSSVRAYSNAGAKATEADALVIRHAELVKRIAFLAGRAPDPLAARHGRRSELDLADEIARQRSGITHD